MCGNGVRTVAKFFKDEILEKKLSDRDNFNIDTRAGIKNISYAALGTFAVNMGKPVFMHPDFPDQSQELEGLEFNFVSMGNPHAVAFVKGLEKYDLLTLGPKIENNKIFPNKINLQLVEEKSKKEFKVATWERGCGVTLACGTGACAVYAMARKYRGADKEATIELPGGKLFMSENDAGEIIMRGPANAVFNGMVEV